MVVVFLLVFPILICLSCQHGAGGIVGDSGGGGGGIVGDSGGGGGAYVLILHEPINVQMRSSSHVATATS